MSKVVGINSRDYWKIRICTLPFQSYTHIVGSAKLPCIGAAECPICNDDKNFSFPVAVWFIGIIDRKINEYLILRVGPWPFSAIRSLARENDPTTYDIELKRSVNGIKWAASKIECKLSDIDNKIILSIDKNEIETLIKKDFPRIEKIALLI